MKWLAEQGFPELITKFREAVDLVNETASKVRFMATREELAFYAALDAFHEVDQELREAVLDGRRDPIQKRFGL